MTVLEQHLVQIPLAGNKASKKNVMFNKTGHWQDQSMSQVGKILQKEAQNTIFVCIPHTVVLLMACSGFGSPAGFLSESMFLLFPLSID